MIDHTHANIVFLPAGYRYAHLFKRVFLGAYYPPFRERVLEMKARAAERGAHYWSEFGYRSWPKQHQLRMLYLAGKGGRAAPAGLSAHNYGLADDSTADADLVKPGLQPTWKEKAYEILGEEAERAGLIWGASFNDRPHTNMAGYVSGKQLAPLQAYWRKLTGTDDERLRALWSHIDALRATGTVVADS